MLTAGRKARVITKENVRHTSNEVYDVESIVGTQAVSRKRFYLIKWVAEDALTWEPVGNLERGCVKAVETFKKEMGWSRLPQDDAICIRPDVKELHEDGKTRYVLSSKKRKSTDVSPHASDKKRMREIATKAVISAEKGRGAELVRQTAGSPLSASVTLERKSSERELHAPSDGSGFASDVSFAEDVDGTSIDAIVEWVSSADDGFITPAASRSTTPMPTSPAKDGHWFSASFNADLVCPFPDVLSSVAQKPRDSPTSEEAIVTPTFSSMDDFKKHMSGALSQPLFGTAWMPLYGRNAQWRD